MNTSKYPGRGSQVVDFELSPVSHPRRQSETITTTITTDVGGFDDSWDHHADVASTKQIIKKTSIYVTTGDNGQEAHEKYESGRRPDPFIGNRKA